MLEKIYYVYNPYTGYTKYQHPNIESAKKEAERLAALHSGSTFEILERIASVKIQQFIWDKVEDNGIPF